MTFLEPLLIFDEPIGCVPDPPHYIKPRTRVGIGQSSSRSCGWCPGTRCGCARRNPNCGVAIYSVYDSVRYPIGQFQALTVLRKLNIRERGMYFPH